MPCSYHQFLRGSPWNLRIRPTEIPFEVLPVCCRVEWGEKACPWVSADGLASPLAHQLRVIFICWVSFVYLGLCLAVSLEPQPLVAEEERCGV